MKFFKTLRRIFGKSKKQAAIDEIEGNIEAAVKNKENENKNEDLPIQEGVIDIEECHKVEETKDLNDYRRTPSGDEEIKIQEDVEIIGDEITVTDEQSQSEDEEFTKMVKKRDISREELQRKICQLLDVYLNATDDEIISNRDDMKHSVINFIDSIALSSTTETSSQQTETVENTNKEINECTVEQSQSITASLKKTFDYDSTASMIYLSNEIKSISFNLDRHCGTESVLSVLNAIQAEFLRLKTLECPTNTEITESSEFKLQENSEVNQVKSKSLIQRPDPSKNSVETSRRTLLSDRDHLINMFDFLQERISAMINYEKETALVLGHLALDMQQFCTLVDLFRQWTEMKLNKLSTKIEKLQNCMQVVLSASPAPASNTQRKMKIILSRQPNTNIT